MEDSPLVEVTPEEAAWIEDKAAAVKEIFDLPYSDQFEELYAEFCSTFGKPVTRNELWMKFLAVLPY